MNADIASYNIEELTHALINTLMYQEQGMKDLRNHIEEQLTALRSQERTTLETLTAETSSIVNTLQQLQSEKERHILLFGELFDLDSTSTSLESVIHILEDSSHNERQLDLLKQLFERIPVAAQEIRDSSKELAYSLQYALHLGHQMIEAIQGAVSYPPILIYTAEGSKKLSASKRMMVNKVG